MAFALNPAAGAELDNNLHGYGGISAAAEEPTESFEVWMGRLPEEERPPEGRRGPEDEPAGDGLGNLVKYAFGLMPLTPAADQAPRLITVPVEDNGVWRDYLTLEFVRSTTAAVELSVGGAADLGEWGMARVVTEVVQPLRGGREVVRLITDVAVEDHPHYFIRLGSRPRAPRPNILFILVDDMGYSDSGSYGGEIDTPAIDRLAEEGVRFSHFRATPMCVTSRVTFLSGMPYQQAHQHYGQIKPLPQSLREAGYRTYTTGKWHAGSPHPVSEGFFDRFHGFLGGMTDAYAGGSDWYLDDEPYGDFGDDFDSTTRITDQSIVYMQEALEMEQPFFMFVSYNAPHHPLQARQETYEKYRGQYLEGFDVIRNRRLDRMRQIGLIDDDFQPAAPGPEIFRWEEMTDFRRDTEDMRMAAYAAMVDEMDQGVGRLLDFLDEQDLSEDTLVVFASDNGGYYANGSIHSHHLQVPWLPGSNQTVSNGWGWVQNTPFNYYKQTSYEGGLAVPFVVRWPRALSHRQGEIVDFEADFTDLYPAFLDAAGGSPPSEDPSEDFKPLTGLSFLDALKRNEVFVPPPRFYWFSQSRAWVDGDYKVTSIHNGRWKLFNLKEDRGEQFDLSNQNPELRESMILAWHDFAEELGMNPQHRRPADDHQHAWGWNRLQSVFPHLISVFPENSKLVNPGSDFIELHFSQPVDFSNTENRRIRLFKVGDDDNPVWEIDPDSAHPSQGELVVRFDNVPPLESDTHYYILADAGAMKIGGQNTRAINDGAFWWRFRTRHAR